MSERRRPPGDGRRLIYGAILAFVVTGVLMVSMGGRLAPAGIPEPRFALDETARPLRTETGEGPGVFQVTLDTADSRHFVPFDLAAGSIRPVSAVEVQLAQSAGLPDLIVRRYSLRAPRGALRPSCEITCRSQSRCP